MDDKLKKDLEDANKNYENAKNKAYTEYVQRNALAKIGDIVTDGRGNIEVLNIHYNTYDKSVMIVYYGYQVTKDKEGYRPIKRRDNTGYAYQDKRFKLICKKEDLKCQESKQ